jgi:hypothetical protein
MLDRYRFHQTNKSIIPVYHKVTVMEKHQKVKPNNVTVGRSKRVVVQLAKDSDIGTAIFNIMFRSMRLV